jgi:hypothetical protein
MKGIDTMSTKKLTKRDHFNTLLSISAVAENPVLVEFINHELELLAKKNTSEKKPTATQQANAKLMEDILDTMENNTLYTISDMIKNFPACEGLSTSKVSAVVRLLKDDGKVERIEDKRKAYFKRIAD